MIRVATQAMGTWFAITASGPNPDTARAAADEAIDLIEETHRALSRFESSSLLAHLRRVAPRAAQVDAATIALFHEARAITMATSGVFNPLLVGSWANVDVDPTAQTIALTDQTVQFDLGAIAKGHVVDHALAMLRAAGLDRAFVHGGTSSGAGFGESPWRVALGAGPLAKVVTLENSAFAVSASIQETEAGSQPHLTNRRDGGAVVTDRRVAVVGPSARRADGWATVIAVLGARPVELDRRYRVWIAPGPGPWHELEAA